jgi:hypothetical protein
MKMESLRLKIKSLPMKMKSLRVKIKSLRVKMKSLPMKIISLRLKIREFMVKIKSPGVKMKYFGAKILFPVVGMADWRGVLPKIPHIKQYISKNRGSFKNILSSILVAQIYFQAPLDVNFNSVKNICQGVG